MGKTGPLTPLNYVKNVKTSSFEYLESLFHNDQVNVTQIIEELHNCYSKIENIISEENMNGPYLVDLLRLKQHIFELKEIMKNKIKKELISKNMPPKLTLSKIQAKEKTGAEKALNIIENTIETPRINGLKDIAGLWEVKKVLKTFVILPRCQPQLFVNQKACNSVLLFGPPGTGKTHLVHGLASEAKAILHSVSVSDMLSPLVGQTEKNVRTLFDYIRNSDIFSILFIDEVDGFCRTRNDSEQDHSRRMKTELMCQMSRMEDNKNMFLICATNCPWDLDTAFLRRFQKRIYIPLPNFAERYELFQLFTKNTQLENDSDYWEHLIEKTEGFSGSDLSGLVQCALNNPIIELEDIKIWKLAPDGFYEPVITTEDFNMEEIICCELGDLPYNSVRARSVHMLDLINSLTSITATVSSAEIRKYEIFNNK
ncbi:hypothetical protein NQ314_011942 [Rhamnusium bicolor]|uniref:AAA+ ATPase domain-containing protein n=1 Tax=Rhamnusium bicolor TaxID=1586634 RepID=A0AAV8XF97_9CUCU|nr:hypothetical protein NQ314_011942 [Rhamnusium bicolor]